MHSPAYQTDLKFISKYICLVYLLFTIKIAMKRVVAMGMSMTVSMIPMPISITMAMPMMMVMSKMRSMSVSRLGLSLAVVVVGRGVGGEGLWVAVGVKPVCRKDISGMDNSVTD